MVTALCMSRNMQASAGVFFLLNVVTVASQRCPVASNFLYAGPTRDTFKQCDTTGSFVIGTCSPGTFFNEEKQACLFDDLATDGQLQRMLNETKAQTPQTVEVTTEQSMPQDPEIKSSGIADVEGDAASISQNNYRRTQRNYQQNDHMINYRYSQPIARQGPYLTTTADNCEYPGFCRHDPDVLLFCPFPGNQAKFLQCAPAGMGSFGSWVAQDCPRDTVFSRDRCIKPNDWIPASDPWSFPSAYKSYTQPPPMPIPVTFAPPTPRLLPPTYPTVPPTPAYSVSDTRTAWVPANVISAASNVDVRVPILHNGVIVYALPVKLPNGQTAFALPTNNQQPVPAPAVTQFGGPRQYSPNTGFQLNEQQVQQSKEPGTVQADNKPAAISVTKRRQSPPSILWDLRNGKTVPVLRSALRDGPYPWYVWRNGQNGRW